METRIRALELVRSFLPSLAGALGVVALASVPVAAPQDPPSVSASVVALDQPWMWNRLGAAQPQGMIFALRRDVVHHYDNQIVWYEGLTEEESGVPLKEGRVRLRPDKRPRPLVLRMHAGGQLKIDFQNLLDPKQFDPDCNPGERPANPQPATRHAGMHAVGLQLVGSIASDGSNVGSVANPGSLVPPGGHHEYTWLAQREGNHVVYSTGANVGGEGDGGQLNAGLFGMINVEPAGSTWYRSQLTEDELDWACPTGTGCTTPDGHPLVDYGATYPTGHRYEGDAILEIVQQGEIIHSDLTAIIADIPGGTYPPNGAYPDREQSFREFTILYHDEVGAQQAFLLFDDCDGNDDLIEHTLHSVRDAFAINYGTGGIGAEILANRFGVGPMWDCTDCKYEEFFLTSWAVGDPAMVVDVPANVGAGPNGIPPPGPKATEALYPDDPSNVYHSYLWDHVKFRIGHGGSKEHHVHHQHAHQWEFTPDEEQSSYLDSQTLGPGSAFTLDMVYNGSGNKNLTVGDSIFHCHFYPHFAQGMWALWRVHDVFEDGSRRLPDGEIPEGTPIPAVVPIPERPMAPMPGANVTIVPTDTDGDTVPDSGQVCVTALGGTLGNPGFPFYVPAQAGHRPPSPPLDTVFDGGLPRHQVVSHPNNLAVEVHTEYDFTKELVRLKAHELPAVGTAVEQAAMAFHELRTHPTYTPEGVAAAFTTNGRPRVPGAPFADPCIDINGVPQGLEGNQPRRTFEAADIQIDAIFNKVGWHFPQMRITSLKDDIQSYFDGTRAPEPLFIRAEDNDCIEYNLTNFVPNVYEFDDFQVRTPTDILGQHIHLVKFDVTSSDGAANGWNYEDGSLSPMEVQERIHALENFFPDNRSGLVRIGSYPPNCGLVAVPQYYGDDEIEPLPNPIFAGIPGLQDPHFLGAQTTVQRWYADPVPTARTLKTVFTHDHFGPSTHQQAGLYAGLIIEDAGTTWIDPYTGASLDGKASWRAKIVYGGGSDRDYREFMFEFADFQLAYEQGSHPELAYGGGPVFPLDWDVANPRDPGEGFDNLPYAINPPGRMEDTIQFLVKGPAETMPEAVSAAEVGTMTVNYRNEPIALRVLDDTGTDPAQTAGVGGDLSHAFRSNVTRTITALNSAPQQWPYSTLAGPPIESASFGAQVGDPFTPLLHVYEGDPVQAKVLVGAHEEGHNFSIHGHKWLFEPEWDDSGYRNSQIMGISEHFEIETNVDRTAPGGRSFVDYLYQAGSSTDDLWNGIWGLMRAYKRESFGQESVGFGFDTLASNPPESDGTFDGLTQAGPCPTGSNPRPYEIHAVRARDVLPGGHILYNSRSGSVAAQGPLVDEDGILYVLAGDLNYTQNPDGSWSATTANARPDPLILRAAAGDCIQITLINNLWPEATHGLGWTTLPAIIDRFNANQTRPSSEVGLHPQLVHYDVSASDGANVGYNPVQTAQPQALNPSPNYALAPFYTWYAGDLNGGTGSPARPIEFGATGLVSSDRIEHASRGAIGALIIEPEGSSWVEDAGGRSSATVFPALGNNFRDFVLLIQSDVNMQHGDGRPIRNLAGEDDAEDSGQKAFNYRTEPIWFRMGYAVDTQPSVTGDMDFTKVLNNSTAVPETPMFRANRGQALRFRVLKPGGNQRNHIFNLHGHVWDIEPYVSGSTRIGPNPLSFWEGATMGIGPSSHQNIVPRNGAGGQNKIVGEYLYRDHGVVGFDSGLWGILKVRGLSSEETQQFEQQP